MPVPESYASRRIYGGRDENTYPSSFSQTRSATRPGFVSTPYTSKLSSATLPPRPTFERKLSTESSAASRYLYGSRTIPSYGTSSLRSSASPVRTTNPFRREGTSVSERIKSYDTSSTAEREFTSRFLRPRESAVILPSKSNGYLPRDRSGSRELGFSSSLATSGLTGIGSRERDRNVRGNIATRAASIGPTVMSRASRNGSTSLSHQNSTEVTVSSKSNVSSETSSANVSRGVSPPCNQVAVTPNVEHTSHNSPKDGIVNETYRVESNCNYPTALSIPITLTTTANPSADTIRGPSARPDIKNGYNGRSSGLNVNESRGRKGQGVKMITETDGNGNSMTHDTISSCVDEQKLENSERHIECNGHTGDDYSFQKLKRPTVSHSKVIFHKINIDGGEGEVGEEAGIRKQGIRSTNIISPGIRHYDNKVEVPRAESINKVNDGKGIPTSKIGSVVIKNNRRRIESPSPGPSQGLLSKLPTSVIKPLKGDTSQLNGYQSKGKSTTSQRNQSPSPVRVEEKSKERSPSPSQSQCVTPTPQSYNTSPITTKVINIHDPGSPGKETKRTSSTLISSSPPTASLVQIPTSASVSLARRESYSTSRSPSPHPTPVPKPPPLPDLHCNENGNNHVDEDMAPMSHVTKYGDKGGKSGAGTSRGVQSDSSDNDTDNYTSSPTLGGRFRSNGEKNSDSEKEAGLSGLRNIGNTCFMNSVLQCLSNTKPLLEYVIRKSYSSDINTATSGMKGALIRAFADVCHELWRDTKSTVDTSAFKDQIQRFAPRFMGYSQQDAQEFLRYLLEGLHEDINRVNIKPKPILTEIEDSWSDTQKATESWKRYLRSDDSKIVDLFVGQLKSTLKCTTCGHCSVTFDPFWDLSLPIPSKTGQVRLSQCLELFTKEEVLDGDERPTCSKCATHRKCTKSFSIQKFPKVLVIHLKRFSPTERYRGKLSTTVDFPLQGLDMTPYAANRSQGCVYNLYGVANHSGSTYSGHYVAYCKHPYNGEWYCYNDSRVSPLSNQSVVSSDGYLLFYELSNNSHL